MAGTNAAPPLAYVFWHWMRDDTAVEAYEASLKAFQESLLANAPVGYRRAAVYRQAHAPWLPQGGRHYVDWYLVDGSTALDALNDAAVCDACRAAHDAAAARAGGGSAGLYGLRRGAVRSGEVRAATWFSKPAGMSYQAIEACVLECASPRPFELWSRRMVLGPTPEFCLLAATTVALPEACAALSVPMEPLWPTARDDLEGGAP